MNHNDYETVTSCDKCPLEAYGGCQHPLAPKHLSLINGLSDEDTSDPHSLCPLRSKPLVLSLEQP
jgi:hypothetical protein